jgi:MYXO-CTERM domain-containing protein
MARSTQAGRQPWWATALTAMLLAAGFRRRKQRRPENDRIEKKMDRG